MLVWENKLPEHASRVIESWRKYAPDYEIKCWNENNFDVNDHLFTKAAYESGKMAFVSDYVRFWAVYNYGGIYMDLGSELIRDIDEFVYRMKASLQSREVHALSMLVFFGL